MADNNKKKDTVYGYYMSSQPDNADISLISNIIQDGVKTYHELTKKFAACKRLSEEEAKRIIEKMKSEGKVGYYHSEYYCGGLIYYFTRWDPEIKTFPESGVYKKNKTNYFRHFFRESSN
jgi:hypothetical protein